jgi:pre-mRNA-splicing factor ATP-dependent RNA helicase DHX38/PRP16
MLIFAEQLGCTFEILIVVSMLSVPGIFFRPKVRPDHPPPPGRRSAAIA